MNWMRQASPRNASSSRRCRSIFGSSSGCRRRMRGGVGGQVYSLPLIDSSASVELRRKRDQPGRICLLFGGGRLLVAVSGEADRAAYGAQDTSRELEPVAGARAVHDMADAVAQAETV